MVPCEKSAFIDRLLFTVMSDPPCEEDDHQDDQDENEDAATDVHGHPAGLGEALKLRRVPDHWSSTWSVRRTTRGVPEVQLRICGAQRSVCRTSSIVSGVSS